MLAAKLPKLCVFLCLGCVTADVNILVDESKIMFKKTEIFNEGFDVHSINIHNSLMTIVTCDEQEDSKWGRKCWIYQTIVDRNGATDLCTFWLDKNMHTVSGYPWTEETAILVAHTKENSDEEQYVKYMVINFTDCTTTDTKISYESYCVVEDNFKENRNAIMINEDNTFDILYNNFKLCSNSNRVAKLTLDAQGNGVGGPITSFVPLDHSYRLVTKGPSSSSFIVKEVKFGEAYKISLINPNGQVLLKKYETYDNLMDHDVSTSYELIRLCSKTNTANVECELFDNNGKMTSSVITNTSQVIETISVENLPNDEFLLLAEDKRMSSIMKINSDGSVSGIAALTYFACNIFNEYASYIDVRDAQYCVIRTCFADKNLSISKECYDDSDLY